MTSLKNYFTKFGYIVDKDTIYFEADDKFLKEFPYSVSENWQGILFDFSVDGNCLGIQIPKASEVFHVSKKSLTVPFEINLGLVGSKVLRVELVGAGYIDFDRENNPEGKWEFKYGKPPEELKEEEEEEEEEKAPDKDTSEK